MAYECFKCRKEIDPQQIAKRVLCPFCGARIIRKTRPGTLKKVKAR